MPRNLPSTSSVIGSRHWRILAGEDGIVTGEDRQHGAGSPLSAPTTGRRPQIGVRVRDILDGRSMQAVSEWVSRFFALSFTYLAFLEDAITIRRNVKLKNCHIQTFTRLCPNWWIPCDLGRNTFLPGHIYIPSRTFPPQTVTPRHKSGGIGPKSRGNVLHPCSMVPDQCHRSEQFHQMTMTKRYN